MTQRTCGGCGTDISTLHGNAKRCMECRTATAPPSKRMCANGCQKPVAGRDLCAKCYVAARRHNGPFERLTPEDRFWPKVDRFGPVPPKHPELGSCWLWTGSTSDKGYGLFWIDGAWVQAHRFAYALLVEEVPGDVRIGHRCEVNCCVNPQHLEPMVKITDSIRTEADLLVPICKPNSDLSYWAGIIDGEGHIGVRRNNNSTTYIARLSLRMSDRRTIENFAASFGLTVSPQTYFSALSNLPLYVTEVSGLKVAKILAQLLPYLSVKRRQAELAISLETEKRKPGLRTQVAGSYSLRSRHGGVMTRKRMRTGQEHLDRWHGYMLEVQALNRPARDSGA